MKKCKVLRGDSLRVLRTLRASSADSLVTDPPAGIGFMGKEWDTPGALVERKPDRSVSFDRLGGNHNPETNADKVRTNRVQGRKFRAALQPIFEECLRVLKPGAHGLVWAIPRTSHWTATALEDAGFEIRDVGVHLFGTGFPKSLDVSKAIDKARRRDFVIAALDLGVQLPGRSIDDWTKEDHAPGDKWWTEFKAALPPETWAAIERKITGDVRSSGSSSWFAPGLGQTTSPATAAARQWFGWGTALKPAAEHWILVRKPLEGTVAANVLAHGTGALNIDGCRIGTDDNLNGGTYSPGGKAGPMPGDERTGAALGMFAPGARPSRDYVQPPGRWPANLTLSEEAAALLDEQSEDRPAKPERAGPRGGSNHPGAEGRARGDSSLAGVWPADPGGGASRFFYVAKASRRDRGHGNTHPTVKSTSLMRWLVRLVTPPRGLVLDPFAGSGSTGVACAREGFRFIGIEREAEYAAIARRRLKAA